MMTEERLVEVYVCAGQLDGESVRIFLESLGIPAMVVQESVGAVYGMTVGALGQAHIYVPESHAHAARAALREMEGGKISPPIPSEDLASQRSPWMKRRSKPARR